MLDHVFIVVNSFNATFKLAKEALEALKEHYPEYLLPQVVRQCTRFAQASSEGMPIFRFDRDSKGAADLHQPRRRSAREAHRRGQGQGEGEDCMRTNPFVPSRETP